MRNILLTIVATAVIAFTGSILNRANAMTLATPAAVHKAAAAVDLSNQVQYRRHWGWRGRYWGWRGRHWGWRGRYWRGRHWGWRGRYWGRPYYWGYYRPYYWGYYRPGPWWW
jgi:hypothetical protein